MNKFKIVIVGEEGTGKTAFINRYLNGQYQPRTIKTIGVNFHIKKVIYDNILNILLIWEIGGAEKFQSFYEHTIQDAKGAMILIDLSQSTINYNDLLFTLLKYEKMLRNYDTNLPILLVGTKADLIEKRHEIKNEQREKIIKSFNLLDIILISAKTGVNVEEAFQKLLSAIIEREKYLSYDKIEIQSEKIEISSDKSKKLFDKVKVSSGKTESMIDIPQISNLLNTINWKLLKIISVYDVKKLGVSIQNHQFNLSISLMWELIERIITYIYTTYFEEAKNITSFSKLKKLHEIRVLPDYLYNNINSIKIVRNNIIHRNNGEESEEIIKSMILLFVQTIKWFYEKFIMKEVPIILGKPISKYNVNFNEISEIQKLIPQKFILVEFEIKKLFGKYNYNLKFDLDKNLLIIFGPNGSGKTTILEIVSLFSQGRIAQILRFAFKEIKMSFKIFNTNRECHIQIINDVDNIIFKINSNYLITKTASFKRKEDDYFKFIFNIYTTYNTSEDWAISTKLENVRVNFFERYEELLNNLVFLEELYWIIGNFNSYYIPALKIEVSVDYLYKFIDQYSLFLEKFSDSTLDEIRKEITNNYILYKEKEFKQYFYNKTNHIDLFLSILNNLFYDKKILIDYNHNFKIVKNNKDIISLNELSSGEKNLFIIFFDCIFKIQNESLILIDEPEISLHVEWQIAFINNLFKIKNSKIKELTNLTYLIATHSPQIINDKWESTFDLNTVF